MNFSQRIGLTPATKAIQLDDIDSDLRNSLWNIYKLYILDSIEPKYDNIISEHSASLLLGLTLDIFKSRIDWAPSTFSKFSTVLADYFQKESWNKIYEIIEYTLEQINSYNFPINYAQCVNQFNFILEREFSGFRLINGVFVPITNPTEINEIEEVLDLTNSFTSLKVCNIHLKISLQLLSDKQNPDYRNSIKESISAVEALTKIISGNPRDGLASALDKIKMNIKLHNSLVQGFKSIYGYTSDANGIRHALNETPNCDFEDAKFMLVSCSAFLNYLIAKAQKAEIIFD